MICRICQPPVQFLTRSEGMKHRWSAHPPVVKEIDPQEKQVIEQVVDLQYPVDSVTAAEVAQTSLPETDLPPAVQVATPFFPAVDGRSVLVQVMNRLTSAEAKGAVFRMMNDSALSTYNTEQVFQKLFEEITDGDERAILRQHFNV